VRADRSHHSAWEDQNESTHRDRIIRFCSAGLGFTAGVRATSNAFYSAIAALDNGVSMEKIWAQTSYVTLAGPRSKSFTVGWDAVKKYWDNADKLFLERKASLSESHIRVNGNLAWEVGQEIGQAKMKDGGTQPINFLVTRVYEKVDGRWLIVSHHAQSIAQ
jgi:ketosteroid isomerase-like protein